jgi:hypothetical protein
VTAYLDEPAERTCAAAAAHTLRGARCAHASPARPEHFYDPRLAALYRAGLDCQLPASDDRVHDIALDTGEHPAWIWDLIWSGLALADSNGCYGTRVVAAHERRAQAQAHLDALAGLGIAVKAVSFA